MAGLTLQSVVVCASIGRLWISSQPEPEALADLLISSFNPWPTGQAE